MKWDKDLKIKQVDEMISQLKPQKKFLMPRYGWLKLIRTTLGMSARSLAKRVGLTQSRIALIEKGEANGTITLQTLKKIADGLNCEFVYYLQPKSNSLAKLREDQAFKKITKINSYTEHQMLLEDQATPGKFITDNFKKLQNELLENWSRDFWDEK